MEVIHVVRTPYGTSKTGLPTTICINVFERQRRNRRGGSHSELSRNQTVLFVLGEKYVFPDLS